jgi:hypothetical protein
MENNNKKIWKEKGLVDNDTYEKEERERREESQKNREAFLNMVHKSRDQLKD